MLVMETIAKIRCMYYGQKKTIKGISRALKVSKNTVRKTIRGDQTEFKYRRRKQPHRVLGRFIGQLEEWLTADSKEPKRRQRTARKLFEGLKEQGYPGSYDAVHAYVKGWHMRHSQSPKVAHIPLVFEPGEAFQFDWSEEEVMLDGSITRLKVAQMRLCYSRLTFVRAYFNEQLEMVLDAHRHAFEFFGGVCKRGIYDNMKTVVQHIYQGKERDYNPRFLQLSSHYCFTPVACTPAAGWEKGQIEKHVGTSRQNFFTPLRKAATLEELNEDLELQALAWAKTRKHPDIKEKTIWEVYQEEVAKLMPVRGPFGSHKSEFVTVNTYSLVRYATNSYSVDCNYVGQVVELRISADTITVAFKEQIIGKHQRHFGRHQTFYDPEHYLAVLERKPGALRNGAPFKNWVLPSSIVKAQKALASYKDGDQQYVAILAAMRVYGLDAVEQACAITLERQCCNKTTVFHELQLPTKASSISQEHPSVPHLKDPPISDCSRYNVKLPLMTFQGGCHANT